MRWTDGETFQRKHWNSSKSFHSYEWFCLLYASQGINPTCLWRSQEASDWPLTGSLSLVCTPLFFWNVGTLLEVTWHVAQRHYFLEQSTSFWRLLMLFPCLLPGNESRLAAAEAGYQQMLWSLASRLLQLCFSFTYLRCSLGGSWPETQSWSRNWLVPHSGATHPVSTGGLFTVLLFQDKQRVCQPTRGNSFPGGWREMLAMEGTVVLPKIPLSLITRST